MPNNMQSKKEFSNILSKYCSL